MSSVIKVVNAITGKYYGVVGRVGNLKDRGYIIYCDCPLEFWCFIPAVDLPLMCRFGRTIDEVLQDLK